MSKKALNHTNTTKKIELKNARNTKEEGKNAPSKTQIQRLELQKRDKRAEFLPQRVQIIYFG